MPTTTAALVVVVEAVPTTTAASAAAFLRAVATDVAQLATPGATTEALALRHANPSLNIAGRQQGPVQRCQLRRFNTQRVEGRTPVRRGPRVVPLQVAVVGSRHQAGRSFAQHMMVQQPVEMLPRLRRFRVVAVALDESLHHAQALAGVPPAARFFCHHHGGRAEIGWLGHVQQGAPDRLPHFRVACRADRSELLTQASLNTCPALGVQGAQHVLAEQAQELGLAGREHRAHVSTFRAVRHPGRCRGLR